MGKTIGLPNYKSGKKYTEKELWDGIHYKKGRSGPALLHRLYQFHYWRNKYKIK